MGIFIQPPKKEAHFPYVSPAALKQNADKTYTIISDLSKMDLLTLENWKKLDTESTLTDMNVDRRLDLVIKGLNRNIPDSYDLIIFASKDNGEPPLHVRVIDEDFKGFFEQVYQFMIDQYYFDQFK